MRTPWLLGVLSLAWLGMNGCGDDGGKGRAPREDAGTDAGADAGNSGADASDPDGRVPGEDASVKEGPKAFLPLYENGTRLRAVSLGEAGATERRLLIWYDTELNTECRFERAEDGEIRCLPWGQTLAPGFADSACTQAVFYDPLVVPCADVPTYRRESVGAGSCAGNRVFRLERLALTEVYHESCPAEPQVLPAGASVWRDQEVVGPERFVRATRRERLNEGGVGVREWIGEDGSREVTQIVDGTYGACSAREVAEGGWRCLPSPAYHEQPWWFADEGCSETPLAYASRVDECREPSKLGLEWRSGRDGLPSVVALGEPVTGTVYERSLSNGQCEARESSDLLWTLYRIEGLFDVTRLRALSETPHGSGRVRPLHYAIDDVLLTLVPGEGGATMYDSKHDARCAAVRHGEGRLCIPERFPLAEGPLYFSDTGCSEPVLWIPHEPLPAQVGLKQTDHCVREGFADVIHQIYDVGEAHVGALYTNQEGSCELSVSEAEPGYYRVTLGEHDWPALVEMRE